MRPGRVRKVSAGRILVRRGRDSGGRSLPIRRSCVSYASAAERSRGLRCFPSTLFYPMKFILALDQGTPSSRAVVFDRRGRVKAQAQQEFPQHFPKPGWVEHAPEDLWESTRTTAIAAVAEANLTGAQIAAIGLTNQRETTLLWERATGKPLARAIVWQDRRTAAACERLKARGLQALGQPRARHRLRR